MAGTIGRKGKWNVRLTGEGINVDDGITAGALLDDDIDAKKGHLEGAAEHGHHTVEELAANRRTACFRVRLGPFVFTVSVFFFILVHFVEHGEGGCRVRFRHFVTVEKDRLPLCVRQQFQASFTV